MDKERRRVLRLSLAGAVLAGASWAPGARAQANGELSVHALDAALPACVASTSDLEAVS